MKITDIKQQQKRQDRYSIYIDDAYAFSLSESGLLAQGLRIGQTYAPEELVALQSTAAFDKLYDQSLGYIAIRQRSEWEITQYLRRKEASPEQIDQIIQQLHQRQWLDDAAFARAWVANRRQLRQTSQLRLRQELRAKRVADEIIGVVLGEDETDEDEVLRQLVMRKRKLTRYQDETKLLQYLVRQGFQYDAVKHVLASSAESEDL